VTRQPLSDLITPTSKSTPSATEIYPPHSRHRQYYHLVNLTEYIFQPHRGDCRLRRYRLTRSQMRGYKRTKAHHLLPKLPFSRKGSGSTDPIISSPDKSSSIEVGPLSQEPPVCPTPVLPTSPNSYPYHSNTTMLLAILPRPDSRAASTKSRRSDNLFKKLLGKQPSFPSQTVLKSRPEKRGKEFRFGFQSSHATENGNDRPELDTPTSACGPHWDCAKTV